MMESMCSEDRLMELDPSLSKTKKKHMRRKIKQEWEQDILKWRQMICTWKRKFPNLNKDNLQTEGVVNLSNRPYMLVDKDHPVIDMLRCNKDVLFADIDELPLMEDQYYRLSPLLFESMCNLLRTKVLPNNSINYLYIFQLCRLDGRDWDSIRKEESVDAITELLNKHCNFTARVELEYEIQP